MRNFSGVGSSFKKNITYFDKGPSSIIDVNPLGYPGGSIKSDFLQVGVPGGIHKVDVVFSLICGFKDHHGNQRESSFLKVLLKFSYDNF